MFLWELKVFYFTFQAVKVFLNCVLFFAVSPCNMQSYAFLSLLPRASQNPAGSAPSWHSRMVTLLLLWRPASRGQLHNTKLQIQPKPAECSCKKTTKKTTVHSLFFEFVGGGARHLLSVLLRFAPVPQVDESLAAVQQHHGDSGAQTAAVTDHLQQMALHRHLPSHAVQTPVIWKEAEKKKTEIVIWIRISNSIVLLI